MAVKFRKNKQIRERMFVESLKAIDNSLSYQSVASILVGEGGVRSKAKNRFQIPFDMSQIQL